MLTEDCLHAGLPPHEAQRRARRSRGRNGEVRPEYEDSYPEYRDAYRHRDQQRPERCPPEEPVVNPLRRVAERGPDGRQRRLPIAILGDRDSRPIHGDDRGRFDAVVGIGNGVCQ